MNCPYCNHIDTKVTDSATPEDLFVDDENVSAATSDSRPTNISKWHPLFVIKKDGRREKIRPL